MFCKVVKSVYICISKQGKCNLSVLADECWCVGATFSNVAVGWLRKNFNKNLQS